MTLRRDWRKWGFGLALLAAVILIATRWTEQREFALLLRRSAPAWLLLAALLQAATYLSQSAVWRSVLARTPFRVPLGALYAMSVAKLFIDQALPSAGVSGAALIVNGLGRRGVARGPVMACVVVETMTNYTALILALLVALGMAGWVGEARTLVWLGTAALVMLSGALIALLLRLSRGGAPVQPPRLVARIPGMKTLLQALAEAPASLTHDPRVLTEATGFNFIIHLLDAATLWALLRSLGVDAPPTGVFSAFMLSTLARTLGVIPGGLGTFEAASIGLLNLMGVPLEAALSGTLLFRGYSFYVPLLPGLLLSRGELREQRAAARPPPIEHPWALPAPALREALRTTPQGLSTDEAARRLEQYGTNALEERRPPSHLRVVWLQLRTPLVLLLVFAAVISAFTGSWSDASIILAIVLGSVLLGSSREYKAQVTIARLRERVATAVEVVRDGRPGSVPLADVVPGDVVLLSAGSVVPADARVLEATDLFVSQAMLTGESFPVEKRPGEAAPGAALAGRDNCVFRGTHVRNGTARALVVATGRDTAFGGIARRLTLRAPETEFDRGLRQFGHVLLTTMVVMVLAVVTVNVLLDRPPVETLLFALALAVGLSPELLPAILNVNLSTGSQAMAARGVLVRRLSAIENLGGMDVLCTDKTGTLTEGVVSLHGAHDAAGQPSEDVLALAALNAAFQTGLSNPLDEAILRARRPPPDAAGKLGEIPYDFVRKRLSVIVRRNGEVQLITKGAFTQVVQVCTHVADGAPLDARWKEDLQRRADAWGEQGVRILALATRAIEARERYAREDEHALTFRGFLAFIDRPKEGAREALLELSRLGVGTRLITGDNHRVAEHVARQVGLGTARVLTGAQLHQLTDEALWHQAELTELFVEVDPTQKERIILALKKQGHVVGFLGDGVNDAPAMHAADASICVDHAADVVREAADFVLLQRHLDVVRRGIEEGTQDVREHAQVHPHHDEREPGQHDEHGGRLAVPALPAAAAGADPPQQLPLRHPRRGAGGRQRGPRAGGPAPALGHAPHRALHGRLRPAELLLRPADLRGAPGPVPGRPRAVPDGLVHRVPVDGAAHRAGGAHAPALPPQPARNPAARLHGGGHRVHLPNPLAPLRGRARLRAAPRHPARGRGRHHRPLRRGGGAGQGPLLPRTGLSPRAEARFKAAAKAPEAASPRPHPGAAGPAGRAAPAASTPSCLPARSRPAGSHGAGGCSPRARRGGPRCTSPPAAGPRAARAGAAAPPGRPRTRGAPEGCGPARTRRGRARPASGSVRPGRRAPRGSGCRCARRAAPRRATRRSLRRARHAPRRGRRGPAPAPPPRGPRARAG
ncbi:cation-translocating P-type ATPase with extended N-terminal transmembrane region [Corallococcus macrosporus]|uniref:Cation-translocating P-type ATPase with extended N-terminal transmembrane region n=1 Tax=Myxococcus fulvus (strain ATCC BAA-855 / HW-1) TaxID=483219 RepID=F8CAQ8_MYXFH|nr:cation-translocating P-type ATPase with extended N-terminal transmembrane region [Corallococcus macrosporus]